MAMTTCNCAEHPQMYSTRNGHVILICFNCGRENNIGPMDPTMEHHPNKDDLSLLIDEVDTIEARLAVATISTIGLSLSGVALLHCEDSASLWIGVSLIFAGLASAVIALIYK